MKDRYKGKRILLTGHTGFKGSWMSFLLSMLGAEVYGYALKPFGSEALFSIVQGQELVNSEEGDIRDIAHLKSFFNLVKPEYVIHMAAQPLVRESYRNPRETYDINVMGTVNVCECIRTCPSVTSFLNVTTDKVYLNNDRSVRFCETDPLDGYDPYSNSKSCSELVTHSYEVSFLRERGVAVSTARAGNVIGGGDFSVDRIVPDCFRAASRGVEIILRNPHSVRPFQHVIEPLFAYLMIVTRQAEDRSLSGSYNIGPDDSDCVTVEELTACFCEAWGDGATWTSKEDHGPHEASWLKLDCTKIKQTFGWKPRWDFSIAVRKTVEWYRLYDDMRKQKKNRSELSGIMRELMRQQADSFLSTTNL